MRTSRRHRIALAAVATGLGLAATAAPSALVPAQAHHCEAILIFSGIQATAPTGQNAGQSINPGAAGCTNDDEATDTNLLVPGANYLTVGSYPTPVEAWVEVDTVVTPLTMTLAADGSRWNSQRVSLNNAQRAVATVKTITGLTVTVTYYAQPHVSL